MPVSRLALFADLCARLEPASAAAAVPAPVARQSVSPGTLVGRRLLLAEDHLVNRTYVGTVLARTGAEVLVATNGDEAIAHCRAAPFDAILMDLRMPGCDGFTATAAIRALPQHRTTPIIALTAHAGSEDQAACLAAGMNDHLAKPFTPEALLAKLARWLPRGTTAARAAAPVTQPHAGTDAGVGAGASAGVDTGVTAGSAAGSTPARAATAAPVLDVAVGLAFTDDAALYRRLLAVFAEDHRDSPAQLAAAATRGDRDQLTAIAHRIKGIAAALGALALDVHARAALAALADPHADWQPAVAELEQTLAQTLTQARAQARAATPAAGQLVD